jgi:hypothetical protein
MSNKKRNASDKQNEQDAAMILDCFLDFQEKGVDELARYLLHCGIDHHDIDHAGGDIANAILEHYRRPGSGGGYDTDAMAHDLFRWPPIAARVKELKREQRQKEASDA